MGGTPSEIDVDVVPIEDATESTGSLHPIHQVGSQ